MSTVRLKCDGHDCQVERQAKPRQSIEELRRLLVVVGWRHEAPNLDYCPQHA